MKSYLSFIGNFFPSQAHLFEEPTVRGQFAFLQYFYCACLQQTAVNVKTSSVIFPHCYNSDWVLIFLQQKYTWFINSELPILTMNVYFMEMAD